MTMKPSQFASPLLIAGGLALAVGGLSSLNNESSPLRHSRNPFAIQGSAYGKLLARLSETTIDRVWHLGVEQIVPHYMSGIGHGQNGHDDHGTAATASPAKGLAQVRGGRDSRCRFAPVKNPASPGKTLVPGSRHRPASPHESQLSDRSSTSPPFTGRSRRCC
jgi:hypothetical protein